MHQVVNDACSHSDIFSVIIYIPQRYVSKYILLIYSRITWNPPLSTPAITAWEALLAEFVKLSVEYDAQNETVQKLTEKMDDIRAMHYKDASRLEDLYFDITECKKKMMNIKFD